MLACYVWACKSLSWLCDSGPVQVFNYAMYDIEFSCLFLLPCHISSTSMVFQWTISTMRTYSQKSEDHNKKGNLINAPKHLQANSSYRASLSDLLASVLPMIPSNKAQKRPLIL